MIHYELAVAHIGRSMRGRLRKLISSHGGLSHADYGSACIAAQAISKSELVMHVTITYVDERHDSIWRKGKKS